MKTRFSTIDLVACVHELNSLLIGLRVVQVYDIDNKTYLIKLAKPDHKAVLLLESGNRIHTTEFEWPKSQAPSGFSMKLRKHLRSRRLEKATQLGIDRIIDLQFGSNEAAYHVILELYDRGNIVLTDHEYTILNILRPRTEESTDVRFAVRERYPIEAAKQKEPLVSEEELRKILLAGKENDPLRKILNPHFAYGPALIDHILVGAGFSANAKIGKGFNIAEDTSKLLTALQEADKILNETQTQSDKGYIIHKCETKPSGNDDSEKLITYTEFHPFLFRQHESGPYLEFPSFLKAVDDFFSKLESQKLDQKALQLEKAALKKLDNVKKDHEKRVHELKKIQDQDKKKAQLIEVNLPSVDRAIKIICSAIANQIDWTEINSLLQESRNQGDPTALAIKKLKLDTNHITMLLCDPYAKDASDDDDEDYDIIKPTLIDIDLGLSAYANARKYYTHIRHAALKQHKTIESSQKAYKSAEKKTKQTLKEVAVVASIIKARKTFWFEKFLWFISSENYLVIGGRDQQQNEIIVKRYLRPGDYYVHADLHGASSIVIKNNSGNPIPPKTLNEAGTMAVCYSAAWEAKVVTSAWWVYHNQVSKTAPTGEYLTTGSFMVRGKKNYLPPCHLIMGFGFLFKLDEPCIFRHKDERRIRTGEEESMTSVSELTMSDVEIEVALDVSDEEDNIFEEKSLPDNIDIGKPLETVEENINEDNGISEFPDTSITLEYLEADKFKLLLERKDSADDDFIFVGDNQPARTTRKDPGKLKNKSSKQMKKDLPTLIDGDDIEKDTEDINSDMKQPNQQLKRRQKSKLKKIKEKYKDQDDEERQLRMELLASAGTGTNKVGKNKKNKKGKNDPQDKPGQQKQQGNKQQKGPLQVFKKMENPISNVKSTTEELSLKDSSLDGQTLPQDVTEQPQVKDEGQVSDEEKDVDSIHTDDQNILDSLTGCPVAEDTLLFAVQLCAPYSTMTNYKYKVKLTPGTGKRGKAAKTALNMFLHDKTNTQREKDLFKSVKDQEISRNLPGKVKVSAPQLTKQKH